MLFVWIFIGLFLLYMILGWNYKLKLQRYRLKSIKIEKPVRLLVISDLHSCRYGKKQEKLIKAIQAETPDLLLLAGDIIDDRMPERGAVDFLNSIRQGPPCYYVTGNHEMKRRGASVKVKEEVRSFGIHVLEGSNEMIEMHGQKLTICGVDDPTGVFSFAHHVEGAFRGIDRQRYTILLTHRPEEVDLYGKQACDLVISGHAHGGQWRVPGLINGVFVPNQGLFPKYAGGLYQIGRQVHVICRGLAKESTLIPRIFNPPEIVVIDLMPHA